MTAKFLIRPLWREAAALVAALHEACFPGESWDEKAVDSILGMPGAFGVLAVDAEREEPLGFALALDLPEECDVVSLGVLPENRRQGIGRVLLAQVVAAAEAKPNGVVLEVAEDNSAARRLYAASGFAPVGRRKEYYRRPGQPSATALVLRRAGKVPVG